MDKAYADTVRLLLAIVPDVFANDIFAMKGGTAINLVVQDMPRLSVDIAGEYERTFVGMTEVDCSLERLLEARTRLRRELPRRLSAQHKQFLSGLARAQPDWSLLQCQHAAQLPALRWKLSN